MCSLLPVQWMWRPHFPRLFSDTCRTLPKQKLDSVQDDYQHCKHGAKQKFPCFDQERGLKERG